MPTPTTGTAQHDTETGEGFRLLTSNQVAHFLGCTPRHIFNLRQRGMPAYRIGKIVRFDIEQVKRWLDRDGDSPNAERAGQLAEIATAHDDNAECADADLFKEFPGAQA
jgi:excisionase family DNA binding protein